MNIRWLIPLVAVILVIIGVGFFLTQNRKDKFFPISPNSNEVNWTSERGYWEVIGKPPNCAEPLEFPSPVDVNLASGILYPGQNRGNDYKPHGGFRFDNNLTNEINVYAPMDAYLVKAARHQESGEIQYSLYFIHNCGIMYKFDHLLELTPKFQEIFTTIPMGFEGDSRTTPLNPPPFVTKGEHVATKVGFENFEGKRNIFFDFGLYDLRKTNGVDYDSDFRAKNSNINEYGIHALCWLDYLSEKEKIIVKNLPAGGQEGKVSDYCN